MKTSRTIISYYLANFCAALEFTLPIWLIFYTVNAGFSATESMLLGVVAFLFSTVLEIPTGVIADKFGPKISYFGGALLYFVSTLFYLFPPNFWLFLVSAAVAGIAIALMSGCTESLVYEYLKENQQISHYSNITSNKQSYFFIGRIVASVSGAYIFLLNPVLPFILSGVGGLLSAIFVLQIKVKHKVESETVTGKILINGLKRIILVLKQNNLARFLLIVIFLHTLLTDFYFYSYPLLLKDLGLGVSVSGFVFAFVSLFSALGSQIFKKYFANKHLGIIVYLTISSILMALLIYSNLVATFVLALMVQGLFSGFVMPTINSFWQPQIEKEYRTTVLSIFSFGFIIFSSLSAFLAGIVIDNLGIANLRLYSMVAIVSINLLIFGWLAVNRSKLAKNL